MIRQSIGRSKILRDGLTYCMGIVYGGRARRCISTQSPKSIAVIGGGIAGLSATYFLQKALPHARITMFESAQKPGGWVSSKSMPTMDGKQVVFEEGPRSLRPAGLPGLNVLDLIRQLGIADKMILVSKNSPSAKNRFIYFQGRIHKLPSSLLGFIKFARTNPILKGSLWSILKEPFRRRPAGIEDETIASFIGRRFSPIMANNMLSAVVHGIYSGSIDKLSIRSTFRALWEYESKAGSVIAGLLRGVETMSLADQALQKKLQEENVEMIQRLKDVSVYSFKGGLSTLTDTMTDKLRALQNVSLEAQTCQRINRTSQGQFDLHMAGLSDPLTFDHVISSIRARDLAKLLCDPNLQELDQIEYSSVMVVNFYYRDPKILPITGFGYLIPKSVPLAENPDRVLGVVFDSSSVPGQDSVEGTKVTCIMGGHWWTGQPMPDKAHGYRATKNIMRLHLGIDQEPEFWNAKAQVDCIPQYTVGHIARMKSLNGKLLKNTPGLALIGSSYGGVSVNDCVLNARKVASRIAQDGSATGLEDFSTM